MAPRASASPRGPSLSGGTNPAPPCQLQAAGPATVGWTARRHQLLLSFNPCSQLEWTRMAASHRAYAELGSRLVVRSTIEFGQGLVLSG